MSLLEIIGLIVVIYYILYVIFVSTWDCDIAVAFYERFGKPISSLKGKVIWITGASSGIGEHLAYILASAGCKLILSARRETELNTVKANCLARNPQLQSSDIEVLPFDICNFNEHQKSFDHVINKFGRLDIMVNNAGVSQRADWEKIEMDVDKQMFEINVFSHMSLNRLVAKYFLEVGHGHFVVTSSAAGICPVPYSATYCATKHALHGYFNTFVIEKCDKPISVTMVCPGPIHTDFLAKCFTAESGKRYGIATEQASTKVSVERCALLMGVAIANKLKEVWIAKPPVLRLLYLKHYLYNVGAGILLSMGPRFIQKLRDNKEVQPVN